MSEEVLSDDIMEHVSPMAVLRMNYSDMKNRLATAESERDAAVKDRDEAMGLLRPFSYPSYLFAESFPDDFRPYYDEDEDRSEITLGDLRRAAAFLASCGQKGASDGTG